MNLEGKNPTFRQSRVRSNPYRVMLYGVLIVFSFALLRGLGSGAVTSPFAPTATPTRTTDSYTLEGDTHFTAGDLSKAIQSYKAAAALNPNDEHIWSKLARIQAYSSVLLPTVEEQQARLKEAQESIDKAVAIAPDSSEAHGYRAFVLDWNAGVPDLPEKDAAKLLAEAEQEARLALQKDPNNILAMAFYAEILADQRNYDQAKSRIDVVLDQNPNIMDVYRISGYVEETWGHYALAIEHYKKAAEINPNLTFLYIQIGKIYRHLAGTAGGPENEIAQQYYSKALEQFEKAAKLNDQLGITDPTPYLAITNTYLQMGEALVAGLNARKALKLNPTSADVYAQLGMVYHRSKNYEGAILAFQCALDGCGPELSCDVRQDCDNKDVQITITPLSLNSKTVPYYYSYGSILAALHKGGEDNYCERATVALGLVKSKFASDESIMTIVRAGEEICASSY